jgi:MbtH protein
MSMTKEPDTMIYKVVVSEDRHYSIWPAYKQNAPGWTEAGKQGTKVECLNYIHQIWTDMRPHSLREAMAQSHKQA